MAAGTLVLFVSCVPDKPVTRLPLPGTSRGSAVILGARREGRRLVYDPEEVIGLSAADVDAHGQVYARALRDGHLRRRTEADWIAWRELTKERAAQAARTTAPTGAQNGPATPAGGEEK